MTDPIVLKAAKRLQTGRDLKLLADHWQLEQIDLVTSVAPKETDKIYEALVSFHAIAAFVEFVNQLAQELDQNG